MQPEHVSLFMREGTSDKEYHVHLVEANGGWKVNFEYGRRGSALKPESKTPAPVPFEKAKAIFDKVVKEKKQKGYTQDESGTPYVASEKEDRISGLLPQLLNSINDEEELEACLKDPEFCMQEKMDGKRMMLRRLEDGSIEAVNRKGLVVGFPKPVQEAAEKIPGTWVIDGEAIGDVFWVFDMLEKDGEDIRKSSYEARHELAAESLFEAIRASDSIRLVDTAVGEKQKRASLKKLQAQGVEGVVFKKLSAHYAVGRPASGGSQLKYKFTETCSVKVSGLVPGKRSVQLQLFDGSKKTWVNVGKVTILPNFPVPSVGAVVEVKYLYAYPNGALYQPVYLGERDDIDEDACALKQLKFKQGKEEEEDS